MKFDELKLDAEILAGVAEAGFEECTEVQEKSIPHLLEAKDVMVQSQTGTGKTAAFLLPTFQLLLHNPDFADAKALIVAPTRELAVQIKEEADMLAEKLPLKAEVFHGGVGYGQQERALADGCNIMVGTPGRILDLSQSGTMQLKGVKVMVIDEADRLFDMGFYPDIRRMMRRMRPREERLNMLFSATLGTRVRNIAWEHMNEPVEITVQPEQITVERVKQTLYHVSSEEKMSVMLGMLKEKKPRTAIVFTNTKRAAEEVCKRLEINGYPADFIIGDLPQRKRIAIIKKIKAGEAEYLVATDVAARGLHIDNLEMVINYDIPEDPEAYVHRIGRTARAGESGEAVAFACQRYVFGLEAIEKLINQKIPVGELTEELHAEDASAGMRIYTDSGRGGNDRGGRGDRDRGGRGGRGDRDRGGRSGGGRRSEGGRGGSRSSGSGGRPERRPDSDRGSARGGRREGQESRAPGRNRGEGHRSDVRRPDSRRTGENVSPGQAPKAGDSLEERLAYYRKKYGEDFQPTDEMLKNMQDDGGRKSGGRRGKSGGSRRGRGNRSSSQGSSNKSEGAKATRDDEKRTQSSGKTDSTTSPAQKKPKPAPAQQDSGQPTPDKKKKDGILGKLKSFFN